MSPQSADSDETRRSIGSEFQLPVSTIKHASILKEAIT